MADAIKNCFGGNVDEDPTYDINNPIYIKPYPGSEDGGESASGSGE